MNLGAAVGLLIAMVSAGPAAAGVPQPAQPRGTVVLVPGSGFNGAGTRNAERMSFRAPSWRRWGFRTRVAAYRAGKAGLVDVARVVRRAAGDAPGLPLCVYGESSGGTWALLVAARTPGVDCVVALGAVTDQETLARSTDGPARHLGGMMWPRRFGGAEEDDFFEPFDVWSVRTVDVPTLLVYSRNDRVVPPRQGELLASVAPAGELRVLRPGRHQFVHAQVDAADFVRARRAARALAVAQTTSP